MTRGAPAVVMVSCLALSIAAPTEARAQSWPDDEEWRVLECGEVPSFDPLDDESAANNERDVVGDSEHPALFLFADAEHLFFRIRVDQDPSSGDELRPFGWAVELDTDGDLLTYELLIQVDGIANPEVVVFGRNSDQRTPDDPADPIEEVITTYPGSTHARAMAATGIFESSFGGDPDFFVDWAIPRGDLAAEGVVDETTLVLVMGTSSNASAIDADLACNDGNVDDDSFSDTATDPVRPDGEPLPDRDGDGLSDAEEARLGTDPALSDTDGDGFTDGVEVSEATDPLDAESHPTGDPDGGPDGGGGLTLRGGPAGCSASGGAPGGAWLLLAALLGLPLRRLTSRGRAGSSPRSAGRSAPR